MRRKNTPCTWGDSCYRASKGRCWFKHSILQNITPHQGQGQGNIQSRGADQQGDVTQGTSLQGDSQQRAGGQGAGQQGADGQGGWHQQGRRQHTQRSGKEGRQRLWCTFQDRCLRRDSCKYQHFDQGFQRNQNQINQ